MIEGRLDDNGQRVIQKGGCLRMAQSNQMERVSMDTFTERRVFSGTN